MTEPKPAIPADVVIPCPLIGFARQSARVCACVNADMSEYLKATGRPMDVGKPCQHFKGLIDHGDELAASVQEQQKAMGQAPEEKLAILINAPFEKRYCVDCGYPTERRLERVFGVIAEG